MGFGPIIKKNQIRGGKVLIPIDLAGIYSSSNSRKEILAGVPRLYLQDFGYQMVRPRSRTHLYCFEASKNEYEAFGAIYRPETT